MPTTISHRRGSSTMQIRLPPLKLVRFTNFNDLPAELRYYIWELALPGPRIILLEHKKRKGYEGEENMGNRFDKLGFRADSPPPSILFVCREAYEIASRHYTQAFANKSGTSIAETYFNFKKDILYLGPEWMGPEGSGVGYQERIHFVVEHELDLADFSRVEHLAVWWDNFWNGQYGIERYLMSIVCRCPYLKTVTVLSKKYCMPGFRDTYPNMHGELKFLDDCTVAEGVDIQIQGLPIPSSKSWSPNHRVDLNLLELFYHTFYDRDYLSNLHPGAGNVPTISYNILTTPHGEELLLQEAKNESAHDMWGS